MILTTSTFLLSSCGTSTTQKNSSSVKTENSKEQLMFANVQKNGKAYVDKNGSFTLLGTAPKGTLIDVSYKSNMHFKETVSSSKKIKISITHINNDLYGAKKDGLVTVVKAKFPDGKKVTTGFNLYDSSKK
ncbi:hypothetical protein [Secundilactobacillus muriivasis]